MRSEEGTQMGPVVSEQQLKENLDWVDLGRPRGPNWPAAARG